MNTLIKTAASQIGVKEIEGIKDNPRILKYAEETGIKGITHDEIPWCSIFLNWCCKKAGYIGTNDPLARSWLMNGKKTTNPLPGDIVIFWRESPNSWKGHAAFFLGFSKDLNFVFVLGGNQNNEVNIKKYSAAKILGFRRLVKADKYSIPRPILKRGSRGQDVTKLQMILKELNYYTAEIDGIFGPNTEEAVISFQKDKDLVVDGVYGTETKNKIIETSMHNL